MILTGQQFHCDHSIELTVVESDHTVCRNKHRWAAMSFSYLILYNYYNYLLIIFDCHKYVLFVEILNHAYSVQ